MENLFTSRYTRQLGITDILNDNGEKLIDASTGNEKPFRKIGTDLNPTHGNR